MLDRVAVALILPGPPLAGQVRSPAAGPAAWLDRFTLAPGCAAPCQPGTWSNAAFDHADGQPTTITAGPADDPSVARPGSGITLPLDFNDRLVWITADELFRELEKRARNELLRALATFRATKHYFPYAAPFDATGGDCRDGLRFGHPAAAAGNCGTGSTWRSPTGSSAAGGSTTSATPSRTNADTAAAHAWHRDSPSAATPLSTP